MSFSFALSLCHRLPLRSFAYVQAMLRPLARSATRWIRIRAAPHPYSLLRTLHNFATCLSDFVSTTAKFAPHAMWGQMSRPERMRYAYLQIDHHLRQFGA